nr:DNA polymerase [uncultured Cohaesibacter sp.]
MQAEELGIDFETASLADLRKTGVYAYAAHPSTRVLLMCYAFGDDPVEEWREGQPFPQRVLVHVLAGQKVSAWNASFEWHIWNMVLLKQIGADPDLYQLRLSQLRDTMIQAAYWGLPLSLDQAAPAAGLAVVKDKQGHALMMRMARPRSVSKKTGEVTWWHLTDPEKFNRLGEYCQQDVRVERAIKNCIPPLPDREQYRWEMDQRINERGIGLDLDAIHALRELADQAKNEGNTLLARLTGDRVKTIGSTAGLLAWLKEQGYPHDNLQKDTVETRLEDPACAGLERAALQLRADVAKTSAAKLDAMLNTNPYDGPVTGVATARGTLQFYGAFRTGRWAGRLVQPQNMPRPSLSKPETALDGVLAGLILPVLEMLYGPAMGIVSSCLRSCIRARPGNIISVADYSQIEARVLPWLARQFDVLQVFQSGKDVYLYTAANVSGITEAEAKARGLRQLGKVLVLACGYGMSGKKFREQAASYGVILTEDEADALVRAWRAANSKIEQFWWDLDSAARKAITTPGQTFDVGPVKLAMHDGHLLVGLPSGRHLVYREARLIPSTFRQGSTDISYMGMNQYTRKWERLRTYGGKIAENITQAVARDVMAEAMEECERLGIPVILTVHDELLTEDLIHKGQSNLDTLLAIMAKPPKWAPGLPTKGDGWVGYRYKK